MVSRFLCALLLAGGCLCPAVSLRAQQQDSLTLYLVNRHLEDSTYYADVWITIRPGVLWRVSDISVWVLFNANALNPTAYINQSVLHFDPVLAAAGYGSVQYYHPLGPGCCIDVMAPQGYANCIVRGGPDGETFRLGTLRWNVTNFAAQDYMRFSYNHPILRMLFTHRLPDNTDRYIEQIEWTSNDYSSNTWQNLYIAPTGCRRMFYAQPQGCADNLRDTSTLTPLATGSPHWPAMPGPGVQPHIAYYQYAFSAANLPSAPRARRFDPDRTTALLDLARCRWEAQLDDLLPPVTNSFEWRETAAGGRMYFTTNPASLSPVGLIASRLLAVTNMARDASAYSFFRDTSACGARQSPVAFQQRSEVVFNNTPLLYAANPHLKWTTDLAGCGGGPDCIDFYSVALHELGHYLGLAHEPRNHDVVLTNADVFPLRTQITQCDADNLRRLYNPTRLGTPPDNSTDCALVSDAEEHRPLPEDTGLRVVPSIVDGGECTIHYSVAQPGHVALRVIDLFGSTVALPATGMHDSGRHTVRLSTAGLASGMYTVLLTAGRRTVSTGFVVVH